MSQKENKKKIKSVSVRVVLFFVRRRRSVAYGNIRAVMCDREPSNIKSGSKSARTRGHVLCSGLWSAQALSLWWSLLIILYLSHPVPLSSSLSLISLTLSHSLSLSLALSLSPSLSPSISLSLSISIPLSLAPYSFYVSLSLLTLTLSLSFSLSLALSPLQGGSPL